MNYKKDDIMYYYSLKDYVKIKLLTDGKKSKARRTAGIYFFKVEVIDNSNYEDKKHMQIGKVFNPNSSTCFYSKKDHEESRQKQANFWGRMAIAEMQLIKSGKLKPKTFSEM